MQASVELHQERHRPFDVSPRAVGNPVSPDDAAPNGAEDLFGCISTTIPRLRRCLERRRRAGVLDILVGRVAPRAPGIGNTCSQTERLSRDKQANRFSCITLHPGAHAVTRPTRLSNCGGSWHDSKISKLQCRSQTSQTRAPCRPHPVLFTPSRARQRYHEATERYGFHFFPCLSIRSGVGRRRQR